MTSIDGATAHPAGPGAGARLPSSAPLLIADSIAPSRRARSILPRRLTLAVLQSCLQRTLALQWQSREERVVLPSMGLLLTQRAEGWRPSPELREPSLHDV